MPHVRLPFAYDTPFVAQPTNTFCSPHDRFLCDERFISSRCKGHSRLWCQCRRQFACERFFDPFIPTVRQLYLRLSYLTFNNGSIQSEFYQRSLRHWTKSSWWSRSGRCLDDGCGWPVSVSTFVLLRSIETVTQNPFSQIYRRVHQRDRPAG